MIWIGSIFLLLSYWLIPRNPVRGWLVSFIGNALYLYPVSKLHRLDLMVVPAAFTVLSLWNLYLERTKSKRQS